jgi:type IV pilus assembly protein PilM
MNPSPRKPGWLAPSPPAVAIEIASRRVTVAELSVSGTGPVVSAYASQPLPPGVVVPALAGVNISDPLVIAGALRRAVEDAGMRMPRRVALLVPDSIARVSLLSFEQLPVRPADLDSLVKWQLRKATPFPIEEARVVHMVAHAGADSSSVLATVARHDVIAQYEAVTAALGMQAGIVDLAGFNVMNAVMAAGNSPTGDSLLVCLAHEGTTLAILRGQSLMFYRHRASVDEEPLSALVHQTAMYHEDRLGGSRFARVWLCGAALADGGSDRARHEIGDLLGVGAETVDIRPAAALRDRISPQPDVLDALAAPVGVLLRERRAA